VQIHEKRIFFAGDTALRPYFDQIAMRFGPFDLAILPIGAYDPRWFMQTVQMDPSQAVNAFIALQTANGLHDAVMIGSHWGTFRLTDENRLTSHRPWLVAPGPIRD